jgi:hypothetical protein
MNNFNTLSAESELKNEIMVQSDELDRMEEQDEMEMLKLESDSRMFPGEEIEEPYDGGGWPGDGSGTDDLADFNANEADDYGPDEPADYESDDDFGQ